MDYNTMSVSELRALAKDKNIKGVSAMKKQELIEALTALEAGSSAPAKTTEAQELPKEEKAAGPVGPKADKKSAKKVENDVKATAKKVVKVTEKKAKKTAEEPAQKAVKVEIKKDNQTTEEPAQPSVTAEAENSTDRPVEEKTQVLEDARAELKQAADARAELVRAAQNRPMQRSVSESGRPVRTQSDMRTGRPVNEDGRMRPISESSKLQRQLAENAKPTRILYDSRVPRPAAEDSRFQRPQNEELRTTRPASEENRVQRPVTANPEGYQEAKADSSESAGRIFASKRITAEEREALDPSLSPEIEQLDSGEAKAGILEVMPDGYGFIRCNNFLPGDNDVYVSPAQIRKFNLKTGDIVVGNTKVKSPTEKFSALLYVKTVNGIHPSEAAKRPKFEDLTPVFPNSRLHLETPGCEPAMRIVDLLSPIGKGQRGMIVSQPKAGKTTLLKQIARALIRNHPDMHLIILLVDERPEEVTDMQESIVGKNVEVIYSTFDELPERHKRVSEMVIERAKRLVEHKKDVVILLDSITRLARAYNLTCVASGRTLSGGLDPAALYMPKKFFGAARNMREGGSLTILATALVDTGSRMDDVVFEEFKGTGNMELVLDRNLSERRIFPAIDLPRSGTRRDDLLLNPNEMEANSIIRRAFNSAKSDEAVERIIGLFARTRSNAEFCEVVKKTKLV